MNEWMSERTIFLNFRKCGAHGGMILTGKLKDSEKNLSWSHIVHHKSHWIDLGHHGERLATDHLSHGMTKFCQLVGDIIWKWKVLKLGKMCIFKCYMPLLTYAAETWTWTKADISRLMAAEMRFLRSSI
jgi:hypothetical protein